MLVPVILAGGSGTRLWPLSRETHPKQFISLFEDLSLFQQTLKRLDQPDWAQNPIIVGNEQHRFLMAEQIRQLQQKADIILEPCFKGTAPAVALAAVHALNQYNQDVMLLVLPADHVIPDTQGFYQTVMHSLALAEQGKLVTFGVRPTRAETGYGYIQQGEALPNGFAIKHFVEKPDSRTAQCYVDSQSYWWNSGMFVFSASAFLQELMLHDSAIFDAAKAAIQQATQDNDFIRPSSVAFGASPADSIDYAVMEKTINGAIVPLNSPWDDVGAWDAISQYSTQDEQGNVCLGDVMVRHSHNCVVRASKRLVVAMGLENLIVIETADAVLVLEKSHAQQVKQIVEQLRVQERKEVRHHSKVNRPWGFFESIDQGERFQVKRITVAIGEKLSLQRHQYRCEHWVVVRGVARVTRGDDVFLLQENQSTYIPQGVNHRLENAGECPLEMIEVQSGDYLGEDDIIRLEDNYGRESEAFEPLYEPLVYETSGDFTV